MGDYLRSQVALLSTLVLGIGVGMGNDGLLMLALGMAGWIALIVWAVIHQHRNRGEQ